MRQEFSVVIDPARMKSFSDMDRLFDQMRARAIDTAINAECVTRITLAIETSKARAA